MKIIVNPHLQTLTPANKYMRLHFLLIILLFFGCTKEKCEPPHTIEIEHNGTIYAGWSLQLKTIHTDGLYKWTGPNGWEIKYETIASDAFQQERLNVTLQDAGEYKVQVINREGCVTHEGIATIDVLPAPVVPCSVPSNTSTSTVAGIGNYEFKTRSFSGSGNSYVVYGSESSSGSDDHMRFVFPGTTSPLPGEYTTAASSIGLEYGTVGLYIETITHQFYGNPGQKVYVTKVNDKIAISFCDLTFSNPIKPANPLKITANITQP